MKQQYEDKELQACYEAGYDSIMNGTSTKNSHFAFFTSQEKTAAWQKGHDESKCNKHLCNCNEVKKQMDGTHCKSCGKRKTKCVCHGVF